MASTVINDPESIHEYRGRIQDVIERLNTPLRETENAIQTVSESWKDNNFQQFRNNFEKDKEDIRPLCDILSKYEDNILFNLEQKLRSYIDQRMQL